MKVPNRFPAISRLTAIVAVVSNVAVAAATGLLIAHSTTRADDPQTSAKEGLRSDLSAQRTEASPIDVTGIRPTTKSNQWTSSARSRKLESQRKSTPTIQLASENRPVPPEGDRAPVSTPHADDGSQTTTRQPPAEEAASITAKPSALSAKERLKLAIEEQRRTRQGSAEPAAVSNPAAENAATENPAAVPNRAAENDSIEQVKAARFLLLKIQLEQLTEQLRASGDRQPLTKDQPSTLPVDDSGSSGPSPATHQSAQTDNSLIGNTTHTNPVHPESDLNMQKQHSLSEDLQSHSDADAEAPAAQKIAADLPGAPAGFSTMPQHPVVDGPIDRLGLANNLYAVGEYLLAMEMYEQTDRSELTAQQQIWTEYQIANCLRRIGRKAEASNRYRRLAAQPEAGWLSHQSSWWVDVLEKSRQLENALHDTSPGPATVPGVSSSQRLKDPAAKPRESKHGNQSH